MADRIAGVCYIKVDGVQLEVKGGLECPIMAVKREPMMSSGGPVGYKETPLFPFVKLTAVFTRDFPIAKLQAGTDMTCTAEFANGKVYVLSGAWLANEASGKGEEGEVELEFNGTNGAWQ
ncbi:phage tail protein [Rhodoferax koreense]|uniref:Phage tail protein n=1 Tax=Rhodoferax koreensis TaxID=1842727 RepID=A0A1P8JYY8_9BURK|nr:phage tail tube protein [Rhodoferax koreense]APW38964.1 phage tail protein [Rhodoferax koreense]